MVEPCELGAAKLGVRHKQTGSLVPPKLEGKFFEKKSTFPLAGSEKSCIFATLLQTRRKPGILAHGLGQQQFPRNSFKDVFSRKCDVLTFKTSIYYGNSKDCNGDQSPTEQERK